MPRAYELRSKVSPYDATYVALAEQLDCRLITADARPARPALPDGRSLVGAGLLLSPAMTGEPSRATARVKSGGYAGPATPDRDTGPSTRGDRPVAGF